MRTADGSETLGLLGLPYLRQISLFGALSPSAIEFLMTHGQVLQLEVGDALYELGDPGDKFFVVLQGALSFYQAHEGRLAHVRDLGVGEEMGFCAMIALHDRVGRPVAIAPTRVLEVTSALFYDLHQSLPSDFGLLLLNLARGMARTLRDVSDHMVLREIGTHDEAFDGGSEKGIERRRDEAESDQNKDTESGAPQRHGTDWRRKAASSKRGEGDQHH